MLAFEVKRPPSWIFHLRFGYTIFPEVPIECWTPQNIGIAVVVLLISCLGAEINAFGVKCPPFWIFPLPVRSHSISISFLRVLDSKNTGIAVGIQLISCLEADIHEFENVRSRLGLSTSGLVLQYPH